MLRRSIHKLDPSQDEKDNNNLRWNRRSGIPPDCSAPQELDNTNGGIFPSLENHTTISLQKYTTLKLPYFGIDNIEVDSFPP